MKQTKIQRGMTLIELVVVMMIIGVLAAVAIPSYRNYVIRSQRSDAKDAVLALATQQEKHYLQCNRYGTAIGAATNCAANQVQAFAASKNGWYGLFIDGGTATTYTVRATAVNGEDQWQDTDCRDFIVTEAGVRTARDAGTADNTAECWR
jgi:type IV pilus assembly protein PilE